MLQESTKTSIIFGLSYFLASSCYNFGMGKVEGFTVITAPEDRQIVPDVHEGVVHVQIPSEAVFRHPVRLQWEFPACGEKTRLETEVGEKAKIVIVEELRGDRGQRAEHREQWSHSVVIFLAEGAELEFISVQATNPSIACTLRQRSELQSHAMMQWRNVTVGSHVEQEIESRLQGDDAMSAVDWIFYARGNEEQKLSARNVFLGKRGSGEMTMKGVAEEKAHVRCDGLIEIGEKGSGTDTYLTQEVLMLDATAKVDAIPGLEIRTNDVKASHSATISRVTEEDVFYFAARGIAQREAKRMFVEGFLGEIVERIADHAEREKILETVGQKYAVGSHF